MCLGNAFIGAIPYLRYMPLLNSRGQEGTPWLLISLWVAFAAFIILITIGLIVGVFYDAPTSNPQLGLTECSDGKDNDNDKKIDFPKDPDCINLFDNSERRETIQYHSSCGNENCETGENFSNCPADCSCGDGVCEPIESFSTCLLDCHCGNQICDYNETMASCPADCT